MFVAPARAKVRGRATGRSEIAGRIKHKVDERQNELGAVLAEVRRRWNRARAPARVDDWRGRPPHHVPGVGVLTVWLLASEGLPSPSSSWSCRRRRSSRSLRPLRPPRHPPTDLQIARFIEEHAGGLDDVVVTAVSMARPAARSRDCAGARCGPRGARASAASASISARDAAPGRDRRRRRDRRSAGRLRGVRADGISAASAIAVAYLLPARLLIEVTPGTSKVRAGTPLTVTRPRARPRRGTGARAHVGSGDAAGSGG